MDREWFPNIRVSASYIHRRERDVQGTVDQSMASVADRLYQADARSSRAVTALLLRGCGEQPDGLTGPHNLNDVTPECRRAKTVNDDRLATRLQRPRNHGDEALQPWLVAPRRVHYSHTTQELVSLSNPNNVSSTQRRERRAAS